MYKEEKCMAFLSLSISKISSDCNQSQFYEKSVKLFLIKSLQNNCSPFVLKEFDQKKECLVLANIQCVFISKTQISISSLNL